MKVVLGGFVGAGCNGTFFLPQTEDCCVWQVDSPQAGCGCGDITYTLSATAGSVGANIFDVSLAGVGSLGDVASISWRTDYSPDLPDCLEFEDEELTLFGAAGTGDCDPSTTTPTCHVTAM